MATWISELMEPRRLTIADLNSRDAGALAHDLGHLFEHSSWIVRDTLAERPFASWRAFHAALCDTVRHYGDEAKLALIREHPDLVGQAALAGTLTRASTTEQTAAGLDADRLTQSERETFQQLNASYRERFGFPFVICAREHRQASILAGFDSRLSNDRQTEIATALGEIEKIAWYRLADIVTGEDECLA